MGPRNKYIITILPSYYPSIRSNPFFSAERPPHKDGALPSVQVVDNRLPHEFVFTNLRQDDRPYQIVDATRTNDPPAYDAVQPVRKRLVHVLPVLRRHKRRNDEVNIAEEEEDDHWKRGTNRRVPVP